MTCQTSSEGQVERIADTLSSVIAVLGSIIISLLIGYSPAAAALGALGASIAAWFCTKRKH